MTLEHLRTITHGDFPEVGRPTGIFHGRSGAITAIGCAFGRLWWPARSLYRGQRLQYRAGIYAAQGQRLALLDEIEYPINEVAIHPTRPWTSMGVSSMRIG